MRRNTLSIEASTTSIIYLLLRTGIGIILLFLFVYISEKHTVCFRLLSERITLILQYVCVYGMSLAYLFHRFSHKRSCYVVIESQYPLISKVDCMTVLLYKRIFSDVINCLSYFSFLYCLTSTVMPTG